jgi:tetratricopeptide (TPR) repeat protein
VKRRIQIAFGSLVLAGAAAAAPAFAPPPRPGPPVRKPASIAFSADALAEFAEGIMADKAGELEKAEQRYRRATEIDKQPASFYNLADVQRRMEKYKEAIKSYGKYLEAAPDATDRAAVEQLVQTLQATPQIVTIDGEDPRAVVFVDGIFVGPSPVSIQVPDGKHVVDRIGPTSFEHRTISAKPLDVDHIHAYGDEKAGNVVLSAAVAVRRGGGWRDGDREWELPSRFTLAPGRYETQMSGNYLCSPIGFDVPKGDGVTFVFIDATGPDPQDKSAQRACLPITVRVKKVVFPP